MLLAKAVSYPIKNRLTSTESSPPVNESYESMANKLSSPVESAIDAVSLPVSPNALTLAKPIAELKYPSPLRLELERV